MILFFFSALLVDLFRGDLDFLLLLLVRLLLGDLLFLPRLDLLFLDFFLGDFDLDFDFFFGDFDFFRGDFDFLPGDFEFFLGDLLKDFFGDLLFLGDLFPFLGDLLLDFLFLDPELAFPLFPGELLLLLPLLDLPLLTLELLPDLLGEEDFFDLAAFFEPGLLPLLPLSGLLSSSLVPAAILTCFRGDFFTLTWFWPSYELGVIPIASSSEV